MTDWNFKFSRHAPGGSKNIRPHIRPPPRSLSMFWRRSSGMARCGLGWRNLRGKKNNLTHFSERLKVFFDKILDFYQSFKKHVYIKGVLKCFEFDFFFYELLVKCELSQ